MRIALAMSVPSAPVCGFRSPGEEGPTTLPLTWATTDVTFADASITFADTEYTP